MHPLCISIFSKFGLVDQSKPCSQIYLQIIASCINWQLPIVVLKQDAREAMRVVFSVLTKRICMHKTKFLMNIFKYCLKIILNSMNLQIATQLIIMFNF